MAPAGHLCNMALAFQSSLHLPFIIPRWGDVMVLGHEGDWRLAAVLGSDIKDIFSVAELTSDLVLFKNVPNC